MKTFEEKFTAWVDGELKGRELAEFEAELPNALEARLEKTSSRQLGDLLREHGRAPELTNPDFFNSQIMQQIEAEATADAYAPVRKKFRWTLPKLAFAGAFSLLISLGLYHEFIPAPVKDSGAEVVFGPDGSKTKVHSSAPNDSTVVFITGPLPDKKVSPDKHKDKDK